MRKMLFSFVIFCLLLGKAFADGDTSLKVQALINNGLFKNKTEIMSLSLNLTPSEKETLINRNKINGYFPMYMQSGLGFGVGSFLTKDYVAGSIHCGIDVVCNVVMISMFAVYAKNVMGVAEGNKSMDDIISAYKKYLYAGVGTLVVLLVNRIAQIVTLTLHVNKYNNTLSEVFDGASSNSKAGGKMAVNLIPIIEENKLGLGLNFAIPKKTS